VIQNRRYKPKIRDIEDAVKRNEPTRLKNLKVNKNKNQNLPGAEGAFEVSEEEDWAI
jgi:hypothetical protein